MSRGAGSSCLPRQDPRRRHRLCRTHDFTHHNAAELPHATPADLPQGRAVHRERDPGHVDRGPPLRRGEPGAGDAGLPGPARGQGGGLPRDRGRHQPVRDHLGRAGAPPGDRRARRLVPGPAGRPRDRDHRHLRQHRGDAGRPAVADQSRRRGDPDPAVLRELLARLRPGRRRRRGSSRSGRRTGGSTPTSWPPRSTTGPRRSSSATPTTRPARSSRATTSRPSPRSAASGT